MNTQHGFDGKDRHMDERIFREEQEYLRETLALLRKLLGESMREHESVSGALDEQSRYLWEDVEAYYAEGEQEFDRLGEVLINLEELSRHAEQHADLAAYLRRCRRMLDSPYFARIDFREDPASPSYVDDTAERIYIGRAALMDRRTLDARVYDWRSPIASLFYRAVPGSCKFTAPAGEIFGTMTLKRQYQIKRGNLSLYVDSDLRVADELLAEALSRATTGKMHSVIETIQARQDEIIRDTENDVLLVEGAAGSGKTAVALHRVAFLLYEGHASKLSANDVLMLSPSAMFGAYVADVLPELGEETLQSMLYEEIISHDLPDTLRFSSRLTHLDALTGMSGERADAYAFLGSREMVYILGRAVDLYARKRFPFADIWRGGKCVMSAREQKAYLLNNPTHTPWGERLQRLSVVISERLLEGRAARTEQIAELLATDVSRAEPEQDARRLEIFENSRLRRRYTDALTMDAAALIRALMEDDAFFRKAARGVKVPDAFLSFRKEIVRQLMSGTVDFPTACAVFYVHTLLFGGHGYEKLRQLVVDEAQDVTPLQFATLRKLLPYVRVTAVGDRAQAVGDASSLYDSLRDIFAPRQTGLLTLDKSYRSTAPITRFCNRLTDTPAEFFARDGEEPSVTAYPDASAMIAAVRDDAAVLHKSGCESVAVICKNAARAREVHNALASDAALVTEHTEVSPRGVVVVPVAMTKGLEFDAVLVIDADGSYMTPRDRRLLYVACTRALHHLKLYAVGCVTPLLGG